MKRFSVAVVLVLGTVLVPAGAEAGSPEAPPSPSDCIHATKLTIVLDNGDVLGGEELRSLGLNSQVVTCTPAAQVPGIEARSQGVSSAATAESIHYFTQYRPGYTTTDSQGTFGALVTYKSPHAVAYYFLIAPALREIAISQVTARMKESPSGCSYYQLAPVDYTFHWSCPSHVWGTTYTESGTLVFRIVTPWGSGTATISEYFRYKITLLP
jgi:hypothetical protein